MIDECSLPFMSIETTGSSVMSRMPFMRSLDQCVQDGVDLVLARLLLDQRHDLDDRDGRRGHAVGDAVEDALDLGDDEAQGAARRRWRSARC